MKFIPFLFLGLFISSINAQNSKNQVKKDTVKLKEITVTGNRIQLPFIKNSRSIEVITNHYLEKMPNTNIVDVLQNTSGLDIRRRGTDGMQADLYIRGGNFEQTLLLIDGTKMDDPQTGHHIMNGCLPLSLIEQVEIIKGPAARIYGQNAFTGAINIVTKKIKKDALTIQANYGSFNNVKTEISIAEKFKAGGVLAYAGYQKSDGYRFNTDFTNKNAFVKADIANYQLISSFSDKKFGANGFYASPKFKDQYEETQTSLIALSSKYKFKSVSVTPRLYWKRNKDVYLFLRHNPSYYKNTHTSNKIGGEINTTITSSIGKTGVGIDIANISLESSNLGNHKRNAITGFLEHRFEFLSNKLDLTPGVAISHYSDFGTNAFPGIDIGYQLSNNYKIYANAGYTYRVPSFTDLYYKGRTNIGNPNLKPESALSEEIGIKYLTDKWNVTASAFHRKSDNLIDWTKKKKEDVWQSQNFSEVVTYGIETSISYAFKGGRLNANYTYIKDDIKNNDVKFTLYSLNSLKHQANVAITYPILPNLKHTISYRFAERTLGESYQVVDTKLIAKLSKKADFYFSINNLFSEEYTETSLVPMPKGVVTSGITYRIY